MYEFKPAFLCDLHRSSIPIETISLKFGGKPVLYQQINWPVCKCCGQDMDFLAQIPLRDPLVFSNNYWMAYIFMCPGKFDKRGWLECQTWDYASGANAVLLQRKDENRILDSHRNAYPDYRVELSPVEEPDFDTGSDLDLDLEDEILELVHITTKIGGTPKWLQLSEISCCPKCGGKVKFVAQIDAALDGPLPADTEKWSDENFKFFHFGGDDGLGYLFMCENECCPDCGFFMWQCS